jgi:hypothetical protein
MIHHVAVVRPQCLFACMLFAGMLGLKSSLVLAYEVEISEQDIQAEVATMFPIRQQLPFVTTTFTDPRVRIAAGSDRVRLAIAVHARFANQVEAAGLAEIEGSLGYDPATGEFHLIRPAVTALQFDRLQQEALGLVRLMANAIAEQYLPSIAIYQLDERDFTQGMMRRKLKGIEVRDGKLVADLDW